MLLAEFLSSLLALQYGVGRTRSLSKAPNAVICRSANAETCRSVAVQELEVLENTIISWDAKGPGNRDRRTRGSEDQRTREPDNKTKLNTSHNSQVKQSSTNILLHCCNVASAQQERHKQHQSDDEPLQATPGPNCEKEQCFPLE